METVQEVVQALADRGIECQDSVTFTRTFDPASGCPICGGTGFELIREQAGVFKDGRPYIADVARPCPACDGGRVQRAKYARERAAVPAAYSSAKLSDFDWTIYPGADLTKQRKRVEAFVNDFPEFEARAMGLYLSSRTRGSGKSFLASCLLNETIDRYGISSRFVSCADLLTLAQQKLEGGADPLRELLKVRLLVLDDLGVKQTGGAWQSDVLFRLIDTRTREQRVTVFTSNVPVSQLDLDDRIADRINRFSLNIALPEYCVRAHEANEEKKRLLASLGID